VPLVGFPKELHGVNFIREEDPDTGIVKIKLPDTATPEQEKAFEELQKRIERVQRNICVFEE